MFWRTLVIITNVVGLILLGIALETWWHEIYVAGFISMTVSIIGFFVIAIFLIAAAVQTANDIVENE